MSIIRMIVILTMYDVSSSVECMMKNYYRMFAGEQPVGLYIEGLGNANGLSSTSASPFLYNRSKRN